KAGWLTRFEPIGAVAYFDKRPRGPALPAFELLAPREGDLKALPDPGVPFALSLRRASLSAALMKEVAGLKNLLALELPFPTRLPADALEQLGGLKELTALSLVNSPVKDDDLKRLSGLKSLRVLDLGSTGISGSGLAALAPLKELRGLRLSRAKVTDAGLAGLGQVKGLGGLGPGVTGTGD